MHYDIAIRSNMLVRLHRKDMLEGILKYLERNDIPHSVVKVTKKGMIR